MDGTWQGAQGADDAPFSVLKPGRVLVDYGPVTMTIEAMAGDRPLTEAAVAGARRALAALDELVPFLPLARVEVGAMGALPSDAPEVLRRMTAAVAVLGESDFTPMAAVAGAFAGLALEAAVAAGATRVVVNNGGDIALQAPKGQRVRVGIVSDLAARRVTHYLDVAGGADGTGVATSGFGGRSLTKGIASAAVAVAGSAAVADALATALGNATSVQQEGIVRRRAEEIDPGTDIRGHVVTAAIADLPPEARHAALQAGSRRAAELHSRGYLAAWAIFVGDQMACYPGDLIHLLARPVEV